VTTSNVNPTPPVSPQAPAAALYDTPNLEFLVETGMVLPLSQINLYLCKISISAFLFFHHVLQN